MDYQSLFSTVMHGQQPYPYQRRLAEMPWPHLINVPTGMGKTAAVTISWLSKRGWRQGGRVEIADEATPRRLIWCLPMRVLVEQAEESARGWLQGLDVLGNAGDGKVSVHILQGGADDLKSWAEYPEEDMILIGTQDMLLSRALMRGYGMSRYQWPIQFSLLHNDALWVFDEVQLMGAGLATSAQLEAFRRDFPLAKSSHSLWLSATLNPQWLNTVDLRPHLPDLKTLTIDEADRRQAGARLASVKHLSPAPLSLTKEAGNKQGKAVYLQALADLVMQSHTADSQTLVIVNRVDRAQGLFQLLKKQRPDANDLLIHSRFRAAERREQSRRLREEASADRIVIATQAIEAGVDISSKCLITELAPWSSLVQRFGRCNRYGEYNDQGGASILWVDIEDDADTLPYQSEELGLARNKLQALHSASPDDLPTTDQARPVTAVIRRKDLLELFNTDPDLSGFDVDVSDYIRDSGLPGIQVFWRDFDKSPNEPEQAPAQQDELCPAAISQAKGLQKRSMGAWRWDSLAGNWERLQRDPRPGMTLLLHANDGGYDPLVGFDASAKKPPVTPVPYRQAASAEVYSEDTRSQLPVPVLLADHLSHVASQVDKLCQALDEQGFRTSLVRAGRWHDVGKAHEVFDKTMHACELAPEGLLAKSPCKSRHERPYFRHELASMLAWLAQHGNEEQADLIAYLIAAHHGKVRMSLRAMPDEQAPAEVKRFARGIWEGDELPALEFDGEQSANTRLSLALMELGEGEQGPSWTARTLRLLDEHGPFRLAWLETLVRLADWRASAAEQQGGNNHE